MTTHFRSQDIVGIWGQKVSEGEKEKVNWEKMEEWRFQRVKKKVAV